MSYGWFVVCVIVQPSPDKASKEPLTLEAVGGGGVALSPPPYDKATDKAADKGTDKGTDKDKEKGKGKDAKRRYEEHLRVGGRAWWHVQIGLSRP